jgi:hypothetical protein
MADEEGGDWGQQVVERPRQTLRDGGPHAAREKETRKGKNEGGAESWDSRGRSHRLDQHTPSTRGRLHTHQATARPPVGEKRPLGTPACQSWRPFFRAIGPQHWNRLSGSRTQPGWKPLPRELPAAQWVLGGMPQTPD